MPRVEIDGSQLTDREAFHDVFAEALGFPSFYGRTMDAWIDCMTSLDAPDDGMTSIHGCAADPVVLHITDASSIPLELFDALNECAAFVNWRRIEAGQPAILALSYFRVTGSEECPPEIERIIAEEVAVRLALGDSDVHDPDWVARISGLAADALLAHFQVRPRTGTRPRSPNT